VAFRLLSALNGIFEHANIRVRPAVDTALSWVWVTPQMHKVHHSRDQAETDTNYGNLLALPDRLFGTFVPTKRPVRDVRPGRCRSGREPIVRRAARDAVAVEERAGS
jgi:sterol desaturase/sphingolipid hydroxylase (fatty acid hydroxylase superfamily)